MRFVDAFSEAFMSAAQVDFTRKISYAEEWLDRAKKEFSDGSTITAANHLILAIAEMETLKRTIFGETPVLREVKQKNRVRRIDIRPLIAAALFLIAAGIFAISSQRDSAQNYLQPAISDSNNSTIIGNLDKREVSLPPIFENIEIPGLGINESPSADIAREVPTVTEKPSRPKSRHPRRELTIADVTKPTVASSTPETPAIADAKPSWDFQPVTGEFDAKEISLDTILAARESHNEK